MDTLIIGASAKGCYFAAMMKKAGENVSLFDTNADKVARINELGLRIIELDGSETAVSVPAYDYIEDAPPSELVILTIKAFHTARAARDIAIILHERMAVLSLQNGLGNVEELCQKINKRQVFAGITYQNAYEEDYGVAHHSEQGLTIVAPVVKAALPAAMEQARLFNNCNLSAGATTDLEALRWKKLILNAAVNPLSALHRLANGELPKQPDIVRDMVEIVVEGVAVAQKLGVPLDYGEIWATVLDYCRANAANRSSMLIDVQNGRFTEIEAINGSIVRLGETVGVDTPANMRMMREIVAIHGKRDSY
ncbi:MAG: 2-dehydropantoate 2-reductase [Bacillota bacterium]|nr:2-dehydropantoate 2-reductase [Bacillota bacterium]